MEQTLRVELDKLGLNSRSTTYYVILKKSFNIFEPWFPHLMIKEFCADYRRQGTWKYMTQNKLGSNQQSKCRLQYYWHKKESLRLYLLSWSGIYMTTPIVELPGMGWKVKEILQEYPRTRPQRTRYKLSLLGNATWAYWNVGIIKSWVWSMVRKRMRMRGRERKRGRRRLCEQ